MAIGVFSKETAEQIYQWYQDTQGNTSRPDTFRYPDDWRQPWYLVKLTGTLSACDDPKNNWTQASANVLRYTDADNLYRVEVEETDSQILVTNRLPVSLSSGSYVWVKQVGAEFVPFIPGEGGGGSEDVLFEIIRPLRGVGLDCNAMECEVLNVSCRLSTVSIGDIITVYDELACVFNAPERLLTGKRGYAKRMSNPSYDYGYEDPLIISPGTEGISEPEGECRWCVQVLCCVEEDG
jgi:hypothetical protein